MDRIFTEAIKTSTFGVFTNKGLLTSVQDSLKIQRIVENQGSGYKSFLKVKNLSDRSIKIYSFLVADLLLPKNLSIKKALENSWLQSGSSHYKKTNQYSKKNLIFLKLNQNPLSFKEKYGYLNKSIISEWYSVLLGKDNDFFFGASTIEDQFSQVYTKNTELGIQVRLTSQFDGLKIKPGQEIFSESFYLEQGKEGQIKNNFANLLAANYKITSVSKPINAVCTPYYWNANYIDEKILNEEIKVLESLPQKIKLDYIQIDDGYFSHHGDWLDYKDKFPNGLKDPVDRIKKLGAKAGIWMAPILINHNSNIHKNHKSWILHSYKRHHLKGLFVSPVDSFIMDTNVDILDITNKEVVEYIRHSLKHFVDLGFELFKIDFIYPLCFSNHFSVNLTRAQAVRKLMKIVRETIGNRKILSAMAPLSSMVGLVDYARTGIDSWFPRLPFFLKKIINSWMFNANIEATLSRSFLNGVVWRADPDCLLVGPAMGISERLVSKFRNKVVDLKMNRWIGERLFSIKKVELSKIQVFLEK